MDIIFNIDYLNIIELHIGNLRTPQ